MKTIMQNTKYNFWAIRTGDDTYLHYEKFSGREDRSWGDILTSEHFDSAEEAREFIENEGLPHDFSPVYATVNVTVEIV